MRPKSSRRSCFIKEAVLKNFAIFTGIHLCWSLFLTILIISFQHLKKDSTHVFSSENCKNFKNAYVCRNTILRHITALFFSGFNSCTMNYNHFHVVVFLNYACSWYVYVTITIIELYIYIYIYIYLYFVYIYIYSCKRWLEGRLNSYFGHIFSKNYCKIKTGIYLAFSSLTLQAFIILCFSYK